jgi:hypothetical protein
VRLQVFATSWRLTPPEASRPCFMPVPLLGFALQSFLPLEQAVSVSGTVPLLSFGLPEGIRSPEPDVPRNLGLANTSCPARAGRNRASPDSRGLLHPRVRYCERRIRPPAARSSPGPSPLQGPLSRRNGPTFAAPPLLRFVGPGGLLRPTSVRFRVSVPSSLACLSRGCRPSWGSSTS